MRKLSRWALTLAMAVILVTPLMAADKKEKKRKKRGRRTFSLVRLPKSLDLTGEQKEKIAAINKEYRPKIFAIFKKRNEIYTPEQRKASREAVAAARKTGKKRRELNKVRTEALNATAEQKKQLAEIRKEQNKVYAEGRKKINAVLTDEQKAKLKQGRKKGKKKRKKKKPAAE